MFHVLYDGIKCSFFITYITKYIWKIAEKLENRLLPAICWLSKFKNLTTSGITPGAKIHKVDINVIVCKNFVNQDS